MTTEKDKWLCDECGEVFFRDAFLRAPNPFDMDEEIFGCPNCKDVNHFIALCDEPKCEQHVACGTPTKEGYRSTCGEHWPKKAGEEYRASKVS